MPVKSGPEGESSKEIRRQVQARVEEERSKYVSPQAPLELPSSFVLSCLDAIEDGDRLLFIALHKDRMVYDHAEGGWFIWAGHHWRKDGMRCAQGGIDAVIDAYAAEMVKQGAKRAEATRSGEKEEAKWIERREAELSKRIKALHTNTKQKQVLDMAEVTKGEASLTVSGDEWDMNPMLLGCPNGVIDLCTGLLRDGRPEDFIQTAVPTPYDPEAECPAWEALLASSMDGNMEMVGYLKRLFGYSITGLTKEAVLPVFFGQGRNGKGTIFDEGLRPVLGPVASSIVPEMLLDQGRVRSSSGPSPDIMGLKGKRVVWASETSQGAKIDSAVAKKLSGGDELKGRWPHGTREVSFKPTHTIFLLTNRKPSAPADDYALWRRLHLIPFNLSFVDNPVEPFERKLDPDLGNKLSKERPGILRWLVEGCIEWQHEGLNPPVSVTDATQEYRNDENIIGHFVEEKCTRDAQAKTKAADLYHAYEQWAKDNGYRPIGAKSFGTQIGKDYERKKIHGLTMYVGIGLLAHEE